MTKRKKSLEEKRIYDRKWYVGNKPSRLEANNRWKEKCAAWYWKIKRLLICTHCEEFEPYFLDFHHVDPSSKRWTIGYVSRSHTPAKIIDEMKKCVVLCKRCHHRVENGELDVKAEWVERSVAMVDNALEQTGMPERTLRQRRYTVKREAITRKIGPIGTAWCHSCRDFISVNFFTKNSSHWNGFANQCVPCRKKKRKVAKLAQTVERFLRNEEVGGAIPLFGSAAEAHEDVRVLGKHEAVGANPISGSPVPSQGSPHL